MSTAPHPAAAFLRRSHRRARGALLAWALALALLGCATWFAPALGLPSAPPLAAALGLASLVVLGIWIRLARRLSPLALARDLDRDWTLAARLETSAELAADPSALAAAQRADAARHLRDRRPPRGASWFSAMALASLGALLLLVEFSLLAQRRLSAAPTPAAAVDPAAEDLSASLAWVTPEAEIKATAIEEVPLTARVSTRGGLRALTLEVAVNGVHHLSVPLPAESASAISAPGDHTLELSLFLDETAAQEFDLVSYHLRAERVASAALPPVASPLQFVQIRPAREDVARLRPPPGAIGQVSNLLTALKAAQLQLLKQNFLLAHAPIDRTHTVWREENSRVAGDQKTLAEKTAETRDFAIAEGLPTLVVDNLGQALPLMESAAAEIAATRNEPAAEPQGRALALIVATEKIIRRVIMESAGSSPPSPPSVRDPFKDPQQFKLPPRADTPAGQLEQLAQAQSASAQELSDPAADAQAEQQAELARKLAELAQSRQLDSSAQGKTEQAARDAADAAAQVRAGDREAARAPATAAAEALRAATAAQEAAGRAAAEAELEQVRRDINSTEGAADPAERANALAAAAERLRAEAAAQQQTGSAAAARELATAAAKVAEAARAPAPGGSSSEAASAATAASAAATRAQAALAPREQALGRAARQLSRGSSSGSGDLAELQLGAQLAGELLPDSGDRDLARRVADEARRTNSDRAANLVRVPDDLRDAAHRLVSRLEAARHAGLRDEQIRRHNPDDIAPAYRAAVETYFEKLSRETK